MKPASILEFPVLPSMETETPSIRARKAAIAVIILFFLLTAAMIWVPWQQSVAGDGRVVALAPPDRRQNVAAPVEGRILKWHVTEGTTVKAGDPLAEITDNDPSILDRLGIERAAMEDRLAAARARELSLRGRLEGIEASRDSALRAADSRIEMADQRVRAAERAVEAAAATLKTATLNINRLRGLHGKGLASTRSLELAQLDSDRAVAENDRALAAVHAAKEEAQALRADRLKTVNDFRSSLDDARAGLASARSDIASTTGQLQPMDVRIARQKTQRVTAPRDGVVLRLLAQPGSEVLKSGDPIAILVPESAEPVVELWIDGNDMPLVSVGDPVRIQFEGWPAIQFVGWPSAAIGTFGGTVRLVDITDNGNGKFRLLIEPDPKDAKWPSAHYLRQGVRTHAWVLLRVVPLGFEVWRQFNAFPPVIAPSEPGASGPAKDGGSKK